MTRRAWDSHADRTLRALWPFLTAKELAPIVGHPAASIYNRAYALRLAKDASYFERMRAVQRDRALTDDRLISGRFRKGLVPANKGKPMSAEVRAKCAHSWFKAGQRGSKWVPLGSHRINADGYLDRKVRDTGHPRDWVGVHRLVWEAAHGAVPAHHSVVFKPGRRTTDPALITLDALECIHRRELLARNTIHRLPPELRKAIQLRGALTRQINRRAQPGTPC